MSPRIMAMPPSDRPRERLAELGAEALGDAELLAVVLRTGHFACDVLTEAENLLVDAGGLVEVSRMNVDALRARVGIGMAKATALKAAVEIGRRLTKAKLRASKRLSDPGVAGEYLVQLHKHEIREIVGFLSLDSRHRLIRQRSLITGTRNSAPVDTVELLRKALHDQAAGLLLYSCRPSCDLRPNKADIDLTRQLVDACAVLGMVLVDHILIAEDKYCSLRLKNSMLFDTGLL
jgi:DNA repair protein RadC